MGSQDNHSSWAVLPPDSLHPAPWQIAMGGALHKLPSVRQLVLGVRHEDLLVHGPQQKQHVPIPKPSPDSDPVLLLLPGLHRYSQFIVYHHGLLLLLGWQCLENGHMLIVCGVCQAE